MQSHQKLEVLRAACCVAGADGNIDADELRIVRQLAADVGVGEASLDAMMTRAENDPEFCQVQFRFLKESPAECLEIMMQVAAASGEIKAPEKKTLQVLARNLEFEDNEFEALLDRTIQQTQRQESGNR